MMEEHDNLEQDNALAEPVAPRPAETQSTLQAEPVQAEPVTPEPAGQGGDYDARLAKLETDIAALPERMAKVFKEVNPRPTPKKTDVDKVDSKADTAKETDKPTGGKNRTFADRWFGR